MTKFIKVVDNHGMELFVNLDKVVFISGGAIGVTTTLNDGSKTIAIKNYVEVVQELKNRGYIE